MGCLYFVDLSTGTAMNAVILGQDCKLWQETKAPEDIYSFLEEFSGT